MIVGVVGETGAVLGTDAAVAVAAAVAGTVAVDGKLVAHSVVGEVAEWEAKIGASCGPTRLPAPVLLHSGGLSQCSGSQSGMQP
jgi:hypothetical protein